MHKITRGKSYTIESSCRESVPLMISTTASSRDMQKKPEFACSHAAPVAAVCSKRVSPSLTIRALLSHMTDDRRAMPQKQPRALYDDTLEKLEPKPQEETC
jgi:hypothetical protein